jgi:saccharopine dehydrogenase-like NADP-dependent oxidoreductase
MVVTHLPIYMTAQTSQHTVALFGAGKIGEAITALLSSSGRYTIRVCDANISGPERLARRWNNVTAHHLDLADSAKTHALLQGCSLVMSALPFACNRSVAHAAAHCGIHYADLTEDVQTAQEISRISASSSSWFMPQCGLAPGFISLAAAHLASLFDSVESLKMRVGALPMYPTNRLKYNLTWSTDGLINEYCNPCEAIHDGTLVQTPALEGYERLSLDGCEYEAFNTSGGLGSMCRSFLGKVRELNYKTIRYPGHRDLMAFLLEDLQFRQHRKSLIDIFDQNIPNTGQDKCIILVEAIGKKDGAHLQKTYTSTVYNTQIAGQHFGAIQVTTAAGICGAIDVLLSGALGPRKGFVTVEEIPLMLFLANEFGKLMRDETALNAL